MSTLHIRDAEVADSELILHFVRELARYEKAEHEVVATRADIESSIFGEQSSVRALICEADGQPIGFAVYFFESKKSSKIGFSERHRRLQST